MKLYITEEGLIASGFHATGDKEAKVTQEFANRYGLKGFKGKLYKIEEVEE